MPTIVISDRYVMGKRPLGGGTPAPAPLNGELVYGATPQETAERFAVGGTRYAVSGPLTNAKAMTDAFWADPAAVVSDQAPDETMEWLVLRETVTETTTATTRTRQTTITRDF